MSGTVFLPGTIITKEWLNAADTHDHSDPTVPGAGGDIRPTLDKIYRATTVGGTANAITLTLGIDPGANINLRSIKFVAVYTNTGNVSVNVNGHGESSLIKPGGLELAPGDIAAGGLIEIAYSVTSLKYTVISGLNDIAPRIGSSGSTTFRNRIINGSMQVDQENEGAAQTFTAGGALAYSIDQWYGYCTGANVTGQRVALADGTNRYRFTGATSNTGIGFGQRMEAINTLDMAGRSVTLGVNLYSTSITSVGWALYYANTADTFGTLASPTRTSIATGTFTITSTEARYTTTISIPAAAITGLELVLTTGALTATNTLHIGRVQLELGSVATEFERMDIQALESRCQRYLWRWGGSSTAWAIRGYSSSGAVIAISFAFPVSMRVAPTPSMVGTPTYTNGSGLSAAAGSRHGCNIGFIVSATGSAAVTCSGAGNYFKFDARM